MRFRAPDRLLLESGARFASRKVKLWAMGAAEGAA
ncbi:MAG: hypothetical protein JG766_419 [Desulfacinum sp.]|jgi:hypothetical protein|nr:hypothetical protein [Desulfacinum sp.]